MEVTHVSQARRRLCVVLIICNFYLGFVSSETDQVDVQLDSYTRENQWDVGKLLDKMSDCPFVKPRGLANTKYQRHKKARTLSGFEVFVWLNVIAFIRLLRLLSALINSLLLRAGDVELNPGPTPPKVTASPTQHDEDTEPSSLSVPSYPDTSESGMLQHEHLTKPHEDTYDPNSSVARKGTILEPEQNVSLTAAVPNSTARSFMAVTATPDPNSVELATEIPGSPQAEEHDIVDKSMMVGQGMTAKKLRARRERLSEPPESFYAQERPLSEAKLKVQQLKDNVKQLRNELLKFRDDPKRLLELLNAANKLYRSGKKCPVCPMCLKDKSASGGQKKSHVIPQAILDHYKQIHGTSEHEHGYMYDFSRNERLSAKGLYYQLLCGECETDYSKTEQPLLSLYLKLAADPNNNLTIDHEGTDTPTIWLTHILANILLRGVLANIDLDSHREQQIMDAVHSLWIFCGAKLHDASKMDPPKLKVFFLPNKALGQSLIDFLFPLEMLLRMPRCTELIRYQEEGTFLYTKFDCFHVVLPLCKESKAYFDAFDNGLVVDSCKLQFKWSLQPRTIIDLSSKIYTFSYPEDNICTSSKLNPRFPKALLCWCAFLYQNIVLKLDNLPPFRWQPLAYVDRYSSSKSEDKTMQPEKGSKQYKSQFHMLECRTITYKDMCKERTKPNVSLASKYSPLKKINELICLRAELDAVSKDKATREVQLKEKNATIEELSDKKIIMEAELERKTETIEKLSGEKATMEIELEEKTAAIKELSDKKVTMEMELEEKSEALKELSEEKTTMEAELERKTEIIVNLSGEKATMEMELKEKTATLEELSEEKATMAAELEMKTEMIVNLSGEKAAMETEIEMLSEEKATMEAELERQTGTIIRLLGEKETMAMELEEKTAALKDTKREAAEAYWNLKAELAQRAAVLDEEKARRQKWEELSLYQSRADKESLKKIEDLYVRCLRKNYLEEQRIIEDLRQTINDKHANFEHFAEVTKDLHPEIHQNYTELYERCEGLLTMSFPPPSPTEVIRRSPYI